ncbi:MAG TPA: PrsW family intramembrane metalloprotease [Thermoplasmata archaeon]|jgi:RsiW-degrading membrane proteinase PrsW (M82 family)
MAASISVTYAVVLVVSAFALPLFFVWWIRNTKRVGRPPMGKVLKAFLWGAVISVLIAVVLEYMLIASGEQIAPLTDFLSQHFSDPVIVLTAVIVAPAVEEAAKAFSVRTGRLAVRAPVDGLIFGAAVGLGFSATENLFNGLARPEDALLIIAIRSFSSSFLHASATAVIGYGLALGWLSARGFTFLPYYFVAVIMHATYNFLASFGELYRSEYGDVGVYAGFGAAVVFAVVAVTLVRYKLVERAPSPTR